MKRYLIIIILLLNLTLGSILRLYQLTSNPPGLYWDEASIGYNAYSLLLTGKDEHGEPWPIWFKAFGDYKYPLYIYAVVAPMKILGSTEMAVRLPSALAGIFSIGLVYLLVRELFRPQKYARNLAIIASFFFAISPWSIQFSRAGFEANLALAFLLLAIWLTLKGLNTKRTSTLFLAGLSYFLCLFTYQSTRMFLPLFLMSLIPIYRGVIKSAAHQIIRAIIFTLIVSSPLIPAQFDQKSLFRASTVTYMDFHQPLATWEKFKTAYLSHFDTNYLFFYGDQTGRHSVRYLGMMYYFDLPLVVLGLYYLATRVPNKPRWLILSWLLLAPLPAAVAEPNPHALRALNVLPAWIIISSLGFYWLISQLSRKFRARLILYSLFAVLFLIVIYNLLIYLNEYYVRYPKTTALDWSNGFKETVALIKTQVNDYDQVYITDSIPLPYLGFYLPIPPTDYQSSPNKFVTGKWPQVGKFSFFDIAWKLPARGHTKRLIVAPSWQKPGSDTAYQTIKLNNGDDLFNIWSEDAIP